MGRHKTTSFITCIHRRSYKRLYSSAKGISLEIPFSKEFIINEIFKTLEKNEMKDDVHIRLVISRGNKITPYQNPNANEGPLNFVIIPEHKKTDPIIYNKGISIGELKILGRMDISKILTLIH